MPIWAAFDAASGALTGVPTLANVGATSNIVISVTDGMDFASLAAFSITVLDSGSGNSAPSISGSPASQVLANSAYSFTPQASDADGDALTFSISNQPGWADFNTASGALTGTPTLANVGATANIVITVTDGTDSASLPGFTITVVDDGSGNVAPTISGSPASQVLANSAYSFTPQASDADGDTLTFSVQGLPSWANFSTGNGRISGTPGDADVGSYSGISITVSDGEETASLGPFTITVQAVTIGSATLSWTPPTQNTDGSGLTDLAGYNLYWGSSSGNYTESAALDNPGLTSYVVENLTAGSWYFVITAVNSDGVESGYSGQAVKTIQ
jgi:sarcosine oxidase gamma subunit